MITYNEKIENILKTHTIQWGKINPFIRERFFILNYSFQQIGYVTVCGNIFVNCKAIVDAFNTIYVEDYNEDIYESIYDYIKELMNDIGLAF